jgi:tetratricopeptide (TPR) repeat protein
MPWCALPCPSARALHFDGSLENVFDLQDKVALSVAGVVEPALQAAENARSARRPTNDLTAYDLYLRAIATYYPVTRARVSEASRLLEQAIAIDPQYSPALAWAALCHSRIALDGWAEDPNVARRKSGDLARQAIEVSDNDPSVLAMAAFVLTIIGEDIDAMIGLVDRALALNPSFAYGWYVSAGIRLAAGEPDLALQYLETSQRLSPRESMGTVQMFIGVAYLLKRQFDKAVSKLVLAVQDHPGHVPSHRYLAACYAHLGRLDEARETVKRLRALTPFVMPIEVVFRNPEHRNIFLSGLRLAAGETA